MSILCPKCSSGDIEKKNNGVIRDQWYCKECNHTFDAVNKFGKIAVSSVGVGLIGGLFGIDVSSSGEDGTS